MKVLEFVVGSLHPFSIVAEPSFIEHSKELDPRFSVPSPQTVRTTLLDKAYEKVLDQIKSVIEDLPDGSFCHLTTDGWGSRDKELSKYNSLTWSFHQPKSSQNETIILGFKSSVERPTSLFILDEITKLLERYFFDKRSSSTH